MLGRSGMALPVVSAIGPVAGEPLDDEYEYRERQAKHRLATACQKMARLGSVEVAEAADTKHLLVERRCVVFSEAMLGDAATPRG